MGGQLRAGQLALDDHMGNHRRRDGQQDARPRPPVHAGARRRRSRRLVMGDTVLHVARLQAMPRVLQPEAGLLVYFFIFSLFFLYFFFILSLFFVFYSLFFLCFFFVFSVFVLFFLLYFFFIFSLLFLYFLFIFSLFYFYFFVYVFKFAIQCNGHRFGRQLQTGDVTFDKSAT